MHRHTLPVTMEFDGARMASHRPDPPSAYPSGQRQPFSVMRALFGRGPECSTITWSLAVCAVALSGSMKRSDSKQAIAGTMANGPRKTAPADGLAMLFRQQTNNFI